MGDIEKDVEYLSFHHVPLIVDSMLLGLLAHQPVTPLKWLAHELSRMDIEGKNGEPRIVFVLGGPGSGKGTICAKLVERFGCLHLSAGDLLREEVQSGSDQGKMLNEMMKEGIIVPGHITIGLLKKAIEKRSLTLGKRPWLLIDGFPRDMAQGLDFERTVGLGSFCLFFDAPDEVLLQRLAGRAKNSGRADDNEATFKKRLQTFHHQSVPVIEYFRAAGRLCEINASGTVEQVWSNVFPLFVDASDLPKIVFVLGGPGCGKGTQCAKLVERFKCAHLSAGDLLREEVKSGSPQGKMLDRMMKEGQIVPGHITIGLLRRSICSLPAKSTPFVLIDGFPREMGQGFDFEKQVSPCTIVLSFTVPDDVLISRLLKRAESSGRADDNLDTIKKRLATFHRQTEPVIQYYGAVEKLREIEATGSVEEVWAKVEPIFSAL